MPLQAQHEGALGHLHALHHAVGRHGVHHKAAPHVADGLVVQAVHMQVLRGAAHDLREERVGVHGDLVALDALGVARLRVADGARHGVKRALGLGGDVLPQRAAQGDVEHLGASADGEQGLVGLNDAGDERALEAVAQRADGAALGQGLLAVERGVAVVAAGDDEGVEGLHHARERSRAARSGQHDGDAACLADGVEQGQLGIDRHAVAMRVLVFRARRNRHKGPPLRPALQYLHHAPIPSRDISNAHSLPCVCYRNAHDISKRGRRARESLCIPAAAAPHVPLERAGLVGVAEHRGPRVEMDDGRP